jgi:hypothetical protein
MNKLNRFAALFFISLSFTSFSQIGTGGFKINPEDGTPLTEVLLSFDAIINDKKVELTWASDSENNNNFFTVEKSKDAMTFEEVTTIKGFGNNSSIVSYFDVDYVPYDGISFYRLKQTDSKGRVLSSRVVSVNYRFSNDGLAIQPNSLDENSTNLMGSENKEVLVVLRNEKGLESFSKVIVDEKNTVIVSPDNENKLDIGTYIVVASSNNKLYSQKVTVR